MNYTMKTILPILLIATLSIFFSRCGNTQKESTTEDLTFYDTMEEENRLHDSISDKAWKEARDYYDNIVDTTFLQTRGKMWENAISPFIGSERNYDLSYNQDVYIAALERAKKHLSVKDNQLVLNLRSGAEINITEDLYQFITDLFVDWNTWIEGGRFKIIQTEEGYYDIAPVSKDE